MRQKIDKALGAFLAFLMMLMTVVVLWGVFTRYVMSAQASWSEEMARFLLIWIGILGAAYAAGQRFHLAIDLLKPKLEPKNQRRLTIFINGIVIAFVFFVMVVGGGRLMYITQVLGQLSPALRVPMWVIYSIVPISGLLIVYYKIGDLRALK